MVFEHAPVTGLLLGISSLSTSIASRHYMMAQRPDVLPGWKTTLRWLPLESLPFGSLGVSLTDVSCAVAVLFQMRILERRWGSAPFLAFVLSAAMAGSVLLNVIITESTSSLSLEQLRILCGGGSIVPLVALVTRYFMEVPSLSQWRIPGTSVVLTEKLSVLLPLLRLVLFPDTQIRARTQRHRAIHVDIGLWSRVLLVIFGILLGVAATRTRLVSWWLGFFCRRVCRPFLSSIQPVLNAIFGPKNGVEVGVPRQHGIGQVGAGGRYSVDNISGFNGNRDRQFSSLYSFDDFPSGGSHLRRRERFSDNSSTGNSNNSDASFEEQIAHIMELGMGFDADAIRAALIAANGQEDAAVEILVNSL
ncbi:Ubiquitin-associated domain [Trypanosoma melophagium]|uniref:Ubiquitin-associated domain n=1 Tax=Trypanosoma melophagium TaxID=715481 RepID=UPI00351A220E|nr:Ubiquitin-associated domain [Trypanosoma melophagium]